MRTPVAKSVFTIAGDFFNSFLTNAVLSLGSIPSNAAGSNTCPRERSVPLLENHGVQASGSTGPYTQRTACDHPVCLLLREKTCFSVWYTDPAYEATADPQKFSDDVHASEENASFCQGPSPLSERIPLCSIGFQKHETGSGTRHITASYRPWLRPDSGTACRR